MNDTRVASRYAKSLLQLAIELDQLEQAHKDMLLIRDTCRANKELQLLLKSPLIKPDKKLAILDEVFGSSLMKVSGSFIQIITKKKREIFLEEIAEQFVRQYMVHKNIEVAHVTTAIPLTDELRKELPSLIENTMNVKANIELVEEIDEKLIGGIVLRMGDKQLDESIRKKIMKLEREFSSNPYIKKL